MDFVNETPFAAGLFSTVVSDDRLIASAVVKGTFTIGEDGRLVPDAEPQWPVDGVPYESEHGTFDGELPFVRGGVDVFVLGKAYPLPGQPTAGMVQLEIGERLSYRIQVFGDRTWQRHGDDFQATAPEPFESIPLTWEYAYGGTCELEAGTMPYHANPKGRGYYTSPELADGQPLPNLELAEQLVRTWQDQPEPAGMGPYDREWSARVLNSVAADFRKPVPRIDKIRPESQNNANPPLILSPPPPPGELVSVTGARPDGAELRFELPDLRFHVYVQLRDRCYVFPSQLDAIAVLCEENRVMIGHRCVFRYRMVPLERRAAVLRQGPAPAEPPAEYRIDWEALDAEEKAARKVGGNG